MTEIILTSSILILLLALLRKLLQGRINPVAQYALWLLAAARLLIPGTLFPAPVSVMGAAEDLQAIQTAGAAAFGHAAGGGPSVFMDPEQPDGPSAYFETRPAGEPSGDAAPGGPSAVFAASPREAHSAAHWMGMIWRAGIVLTGSAMLLSNLIFYLRLRKRRKPLDLPVRYRKTRVYEMDGLPSPCLFGLFRPAVYLNEAALSSGRLEHILIHEYTHYRHGDHFWAVLRSVCLAVHWVNPLVWWACALSRRDCELACDEAAIRRLGGDQRLDYGQTLLQMVRKHPAPGDFFHTATTMTAGKRAMKERIALIAKRPKPRKTTAAAVLLAVCALASCTFGGKGRPQPDGAISELLEFPGVQWNDSVETVMEKLNLTEGQFLETYEDSSDMTVYEFVIGDYPLLGGTAQYVSFMFTQHTGDGEPGLSSVRAFYPDGMEDFSSVRETLEALCGPGTDTTTTPAVNESWKNVLGDRYGRWEELLQTPGIHSMAWDVGVDSVPEQYGEKMKALYEPARSPLSETAEFQKSPDEYMEIPMARISWDDRSVLSPTFNVVYFTGDVYVMLTQILAEEGASAPLPENAYMARTPATPDGSGPLHEALSRLDALRDEELIGYAASGKDGAPANGGYSPAATLPVLEEAFRACRWARADAPEDGEPVHWRRTVIGGFTFYDGSLLVSYSHGGEVDWYSVPEGWLTVQAALEYANDRGRTLAEKKGLYLYEQARITWDMFQFGLLPTRYDGPVREEGGLAWLPVGFYESAADMRGYLRTIFSPEIADYLMSMRQFSEGNGHLYVYGPVDPQPGSSRNPYAAEETAPQVFPFTAEEAAQYGYDGHIFVQTPVLDYDLKTVLGYKRHDYDYKWNGTHYVFTNFSPFDDVDPQVYYNAENILRQYQQNVDPGQWLYLLDYMDWQAVGKAAGSYSSSAEEVMSALQSYAARQGASLTAAGMASILTATDGLDGALSEGYQTLVYQLYEASPALFAQIVLNELPQPQKNAVLDYFRYEWTYRQEAYKNFMDREGIIEILEQELAAASGQPAAPDSEAEPGIGP